MIQMSKKELELVMFMDSWSSIMQNCKNIIRYLIRNSIYCNSFISQVSNNDHRLETHFEPEGHTKYVDQACLDNQPG